MKNYFELLYKRIIACSSSWCSCSGLWRRYRCEVCSIWPPSSPRTLLSLRGKVSSIVGGRRCSPGYSVSRKNPCTASIYAWHRLPVQTTMSRRQPRLVRSIPWSSDSTSNSGQLRILSCISHTLQHNRRPPIARSTCSSVCCFCPCTYCSCFCNPNSYIQLTPETPRARKARGPGRRYLLFSFINLL